MYEEIRLCKPCEIVDLACQDRLLASPRTSAFCESIPQWEFDKKEQTPAAERQT